MRAKIGSKSVEIERIGKDRFVIDGKEYRVDAKSLRDSHYSLTIEGYPYQVKVVGGEDEFHVTVGEEELAVQFTESLRKSSDREPDLIDGKAFIRSPLPGIVVDIGVELNQAVRRGEKIIVVETMKMENEFLSPIDGRVTEISVAVGDDIEAEQNLVTIESS